MKTIKQYISEGILDIDIDVDVEPIVPVKIGQSDLDQNYTMNIERFNKDIYIPLANQKIEAFIAAAKELRSYCDEHNMETSPHLRNATKDASNLGLFTLQFEPKEISAARELNDVFGKAMKDAKFKKFVQSKQIFDISLGTRQNYAYLGFWWEDEYPGIDDIVKKLEGINRSVEVKMNTSQDGDHWIQLKLSYK